MKQDKSSRNDVALILWISISILIFSILIFVPVLSIVYDTNNLKIENRLLKNKYSDIEYDYSLLQENYREIELSNESLKEELAKYKNGSDKSDHNKSLDLFEKCIEK